MKRLLLLLFWLVCCSPFSSGTPHTDSDFQSFEAEFLAQLWKAYPTWASSVGYHLYDSLLPAPNDANREKELSFCSRMLSELKQYNPSDLSSSERVNYYIIENQLLYLKWNIEELKEYQWNPALYNVSGVFAEMLSNNYSSIDIRLSNFMLRLDKVPAYYEAAKQSIYNPTLAHTQLAIEQNEGGLTVFTTDLNNAIEQSSLSKNEIIILRNKSQRAVNAIEAYVNWLKKLDNPNPRSNKLGEVLYEQKFKFELQSKFTAKEIFNKAMQQKMATHKKMYEITASLWPKYFGGKIPERRLQAVRMLIDTLSSRHVSANDFQACIERQIPKLTRFIKKKNLIILDPTKPLIVRREPDYMAGVAGASISAPGPYDKSGNTYYNVGSLDGWSIEKSESYLREYNNYVLQILNIHEAIPGHYTQLVHANANPSLIKSIFGNNTMIEGWAVYAERMMLENGYDIDTANKGEASPEMWLMYYKWHLRSICNTILDYGVHTGKMTKEAAMELLMKQAFQEKTEALGKWNRVNVTQTQLCCYFTGFTEIFEFREEYKSLMKDAFHLKKFHEDFLGKGSAPVKYTRQLMLEQKNR